MGVTDADDHGQEGGTNQKPLTCFCVIKHDGTAVDRAIIATPYAGGFYWGLNTAGRQVSNKHYVIALGTSTTVVPSNVPVLLSMTYSETGLLSFFLDGVADGAVTNDQTFTASPAQTQMGDGTSQPFIGQIGEVIKYDRVLTVAERHSIERYLRNKWIGGSEVQLRMTGVLNAVLSTPDVAAFAIPDDITIDWFGSVDNLWDEDQSLFSQWTTVGNMRSWALRLNFNSGVIDHPRVAFWWSNTGSGSGSTSVRPLLPIRPGQAFGLRATRRRSDALVKVYFSATDPPNWELILTSSLGTAGQTFFASTYDLTIGGTGASTGTTSMHTGHFRRAELRNGFDGAGTVIASPNVTGLALGTTSFNDAQGNPWTLGPTLALVNKPIAPEPYKDMWVGDKRMWPVKDGYIRHGTTTNWNNISTPDIAAFQVTDLDVRWYGQIDWSTSGGIFDQWNVNGDQRAWLMEMGGGQTRLSFSTTGLNQYMSNLVTFPFAVGAPGGVRYTRVQSTGLTRLYFSTDGVNWVEQVAGQTVMGAAAAMFNATSPILIGGYNDNGGTGRIAGVTHYAELRNGINGPVVFRHGPESLRGVGRRQASWTCETGQTVTRVGSASTVPWVYPTVRPDDIMDIYEGDRRTWPGGDGHVTLDGTFGTDLVVSEEVYLIPRIGTIKTPDPGNLPTDCVLIMKVRGPNTGQTAQQVIVQQAVNSGGTNNSWQVARTCTTSSDNGELTGGISQDGTASYRIAGPTTGALVTNQDEWLAFSMASGVGRTFTGVSYRSTDNGATWTSTGSQGSWPDTVPFDSSLPVDIGGDGTSLTTKFNGRISSVEMRTGLVPSAGSTIWKFDAREYLSAARTASSFHGGPNSGIHASTTLQITTDVVITVRCTLTVTNNGLYLANIWGTSASSQLWGLSMTSAEALQFDFQDTGNVIQTFELLSTAEVAALNILDSTTVVDIGVRFERNTGGVCRAVAIRSTDGGTVWNEIGTAKTGTAVTASRVSANAVAVGMRTDTGGPNSYCMPAGTKMFRAEMRTGTDPNGGTVLWRLDPADYPVTSTTKTWTDPRGMTWRVVDPEFVGDVSYTDPRGRIWTLARNGAIEGKLHNTGNNGSAEVVVRPRNGWNNIPTLVAKLGSTGACWAFCLSTSGAPQFYWTTDGTWGTIAAVQAPILLGSTFPTNKWVRLRVSWESQYSGSNSRIIFSGALDGEPMQVLSTVTTGVNFNMLQGTAPITVGSIYDDWWANADFKYAEVRDGAGNAVWTMDRNSFKVGRRARSLPSRANDGAYLDPVNTSRPSMPDFGNMPDEFTFVYKSAGPYNTSASYRYIVSQGSNTASQRSFKWAHYPGFLASSARSDFYPSGTSSPSSPHSPDILPRANNLKPQVMAASFNAGNGLYRIWNIVDGVWVESTSGAGTPFTMFNSTAPILIGDDGTNGLTSWWDDKIYWVEMRTGQDPKRGKVLWRFDANDYPGGGVTTWTDPRGHVWTLESTMYVARAIVPLVGDIAVRGAAKVYPSVSEMKARWGEFQWNDGSKWSA